MAPRSDLYPADQLRDAIVAVHLDKVVLANVPVKFSVPTRQVRAAISDLDAINAIRIGSKQAALIENEDRCQVFQWATKYANARMPTDGSNHTEWELRQCIINDITRKMKLQDAMEEFGISKGTYKKYTDKVVELLGLNSLKEVRSLYKSSQLSYAKIQGAIERVPKLKPGRKPLLTADEEALVIATAEMKGAGLPSQLTWELDCSRDSEWLHGQRRMV